MFVFASQSKMSTANGDELEGFNREPFNRSQTINHERGDQHEAAPQDTLLDEARSPNASERQNDDVLPWVYGRIDENNINTVSDDIGKNRSTPDVTGAGADRALSVLLAKRDKIQNKLQNQTALVGILLGANNVDLLNDEIANVDRSLYEFMEVNERCYGTANEQESVESVKVADEHDTKVFELKKCVYDWI